MAATRLIALHKNKGKSVAACLKSRTDYVQNPDKTEQGELVSCYECSPLTVDPHQKQPPKEQPFQLLVDIQAKLAEGKSGGYQRSFIITSTRNAPASFTPARAFLVLFKNIGKGKQLYFSAFLCLK